MASKNYNHDDTSSNYNTDEFDIIDFDLNEFDEEFEKEAQKQKRKENNKETKLSSPDQVHNAHKKSKNDGEPNRDMLKTILLILVVIVIACLVLGFISFVVNISSGHNKKDRTTKATTEFRAHEVMEEDSQKENIESDEAEEKKEFEESIEEITNNVINDTTEEKEPTTTEQPTTEATTETPTTEAPTTEEPTTEAPTTEVPVPDTPVEPEEDINIDATPAE